MGTRTLTSRQVRAVFRARGISFARWAQEHGYSPRLVIAVVQGKIKGNYGKAHTIAVALGMKADPVALDKAA